MKNDMSSAHTFHPPCPYQRLCWCWSHLKAKKEKKIPQACTFRHQIARGMAPTLPPIAQSINASHIWAPSTQISQITRNHTLCVTKLHAHLPTWTKNASSGSVHLYINFIGVFWCVFMCIVVCIYVYGNFIDGMNGFIKNPPPLLNILKLCGGDFSQLGKEEWMLLER